MRVLLEQKSIPMIKLNNKSVKNIFLVLLIFIIINISFYLFQKRDYFIQPEASNFYRFYSQRFRKYIYSSTKNQLKIFDFRKLW